MFGRIGAGGLQAIKDRQMQRGERLTPELEASLAVIQAVLATKPKRIFELWWNAYSRVLAASDVAEDEPKRGAGGFHLIFMDPVQTRHSFVSTIDEHVYQLFQEGGHHIAQLELSMILYGLIARPSGFRNQRGIWFVDNNAALMSLIRGRSSSPDLEKLAQVIHLCLFALNCTLHWERIPSKSSRGDDISRLAWVTGTNAL